MTLRNTPDPTLIRRWIAALRSGRYTQTQGYLHIDKGHCCLGVLCDIINPTGWVWGANIGYYVGFSDTPPQAICDLAGLGARENPAGPTASYVPELTAMNDRGTPFPEIADYVERHILPQAEGGDTPCL